MADEGKSGKKKGGASGVIGMAAAMGLVTVLAVGAGWYVGSQIRVTKEVKPTEQVAADLQSEKSKDAALGRREAPATTDAHSEATAEGSGLSLFGGPSSVKLEPIVSNIGSSGDEWMRLEVAVLYGGDVGTIPDSEVYTISEAIVAMLHRKDKSELSGPSGFLQFREDLVDTVKVATGGRANSAKILSMVVE